MLECVVNISEGRDQQMIDAVAAAAGGYLLDVHTDRDHHRSVLTLAGPQAGLEQAVRAVVEEGVGRIDLGGHDGAHPRLGAVDVVPFVPLDGEPLTAAIAARGRFCSWAAAALGIPCFLYGPERSLPEVRRQAFVDLAPDAGPASPHPTAGAICVGARPLLIAYNLWLAADTPLETARRVAAEVRGPAVRALGLQVGAHTQVSLNLIDPATVGPAQAYDAVATMAPVEWAELVGLVPMATLRAIPPDRWPSLDLHPARTIEYRLAGTPGLGYF